MRTSRLFVEMPLADGAIVTLADASAHYLHHVLRLRRGDPVIVFNGNGGEFAAEVIAVDRHSVDLRVGSYAAVTRESPLLTTLGIGLTKRDAMDLAIQKATELGVTEITPLHTAHSAKAAKGADGRTQHWQQVSRSASEQCGRNVPPHLNPVTPLDNWLTTIRADIKLVAHPYMAGTLAVVSGTPRSVALLVGPEGGLADDEVALACANGFTPVTLGPRILRAETAPIALLSLIQARWGDLHTDKR
jgi:16S rRNA (uracil1498-N3)-methyltransferase